MFDYPYICEILSPKRDSGERLEFLLDGFAEKYQQALAAGCGVSVPDNPMGQRRISLLECIEKRALPVDPSRIVMNLNTFHAKREMDHLLATSAELGITNILVVRGDGGPDLPRLDPAEIGGKHSVATTPDLLRYINSCYPGQFQTGVAFNPYKKTSFEIPHLERKIEAGAAFIITQPIIGANAHVNAAKDLGLPMVVEAWMSDNIDLFYRSVGMQNDGAETIYDPVNNLRELHAAYPECCVYLALLNYKSNWQEILPQL